MFLTAGVIWILNYWSFDYLSLVWSWVSENVCLINHMKLFWPQTPSAASDKKCQNSKLFLLNFCPNLYTFSFYSEAIWFKICQEWQLTWYYQGLFGFTVIMQVFSTLLKREILSFSTILISSANTNKKTAKAKHIVQFIRQAVSLRIYWTIQAQNQKKINQNLDKNEQKQLWILTLFIWGCRGCLRSNFFQMVDQA